MDKDKLCIINEILKEFILDNDKNKTWIYQINQSDEWLDATYEAFLEMESEFHNLLKIQRSKIIESIENKNKTWIYQINQSDEWLDATYEAFLEMESEFHNLLKIQRSKIIESIENGTVTNEILKIYIENIEKQQVLYEQIVYKNFLNIMNLVKQEILSELGQTSISITFDLLNEKALKFLEDKKIKFAIKVADTTHKAIINELSEGFEKGESIQELSNRIKDMPEFDMKRAAVVARTEIISSSNAGTLQGYKESGVVIGKEWSSTKIKDMPEFDMKRAAVVARTEIISSSNAGTLQGYKESGVVIGKEWSSTKDERTRDHHKDVEGQRVALDNPFIVDGDLLDYPGDNSYDAKASNVIQCRCSLKPILEGEVI